MMKRLFLTVLLFLLVCSSVSCGQREEMTPRALFDRFAAGYPLMPGHLYDSLATEEEDTWLPPDLFHSLYARLDGSDDREDIQAFVLYLGSAGTVWYELAVFQCSDRAAAEEVAALCLLRCKTVREMRGTAVDLTAATEPRIVFHGSFLFFLALPDNDRALRVLNRIL